MNTKQLRQRIKFNDMEELGKRRHLNRIYKMTQAIHDRFPTVNQSNQVRLKHLSWLLNHWFKNQKYSSSTLKDYRSSLILLIETYPNAKDWLRRLGLHKKGVGGRPRKAIAVKTKKIK